MSWKPTRLDTITEVITKGTTPTTLGYDFAESGIPFLRVQNISGGNVNYEKDTLFIDEKTHASLSRSQIQHGDILVSIAGTIGRAGVVPANAPPLNCNQAVAIVRPTQQVFRPFLRLWIESSEAQSQMRNSTVTGTISNLSLSQLGNLEIPLPPLAQQRRIAEVLDRAEALRAKRRAALAQLDSLTQSLFFDLFGDPVSNPKRWLQKPLTEACYCYSGGTPSKANSALWTGSLPWFSAKDLKQPDLFDSQDHISAEVPNATSLKLLPENTVSIVVRGMILAHTFPVCVLRVPATINQDLKALLPNEPIEPQFLAANLRSASSFALQQVSEAGHGTKRLDAEGLRKIPILFPPLPLQREFARRVTAVEKLKTSHRASLAELDALFATLQHRAFRGEL